MHKCEHKGLISTVVAQYCSKFKVSAWAHNFFMHIRYAVTEKLQDSGNPPCLHTRDQHVN